MTAPTAPPVSRPVTPRSVGGSVGAVLRMTPEVRDHMFAHAIDGLPNEACGMFSALNGCELVDVFHPMKNAAESALLFELDGQEMMHVEKAIDRADRSVIGVMHSHTNTSAYPSPTDVRDIGRFDPFAAFRHVIVSLRDAEPIMRCFTLLGGAVTEVPIVIHEDTEVDNDGSGAAVAAVQALPKPDS